MKARAMKRYAGFFVALLLSVALLFAACSGSSVPTTGDKSFIVRITGDAGQAFTGSYVMIKDDDSIITGQLEGNALEDYRVDGTQINLTVQKATATGYLKVQILLGRDVVAEGEITAAFGSINLTGH
jgi:hypothetical protein